MSARGESRRLAEWLRETIGRLRAAGVEDPVRDARLLAAAGCGLSHAQVLTEPERPLTAAEFERLEVLCLRRVRREPISRILGRRGFMNLDLEVTPATLDPRPDTETLVEAVLATLAREGRSALPLSLVDLGTGSGAILIALLQALPRARGLGIDLSSAALDVAGRNAQRGGVGERACWRQGNWFDGVTEAFDLVVSNPPYIPSDEIARLDPEVVNHDPRLALDGGVDGLAAYRSIIAQAGAHIRPGGWLFLEVGAGQAEPVADLLRHAAPTAPGSAPIAVFPDLAGHLRCVAQKSHA